MPTDREIIKQRAAGTAETFGLAASATTAVGQIHEETFVFSNVAGSPLAEVGIQMRKACRVKAVVILPAAGLATNATNFVTGTVAKRDAAGGSLTSIASFTTNSSGGAALVAFVAQNLTLTASAVEIAAGASLTYALVDAATTTEVAVFVSVTVEYI